MRGKTIAVPDEGAPEAAGPALRVCIVLDKATASLLDATRLAMPDTEINVHGGSLSTFVADTALARSTDVLIVQVETENPRSFEEFERFVQENSGRLPVIAAVRDLTVAATRRVLRSDAVDVLPIPFTPDELHQAIETGRMRREAAMPRGRTRSGRVVTMVGALGGMGTTAIAVQSGLVWAEKKSVCLIDLDVQFGNAALYLNMRTQLSLSDLIEAGDRMDDEFLRSVADRHSSGMSIVACPPDIMPLDMLTPEFVDKLIDVAAQTYDVVLVDLPSAWVNWSLSVLQRSDAICLVTNISVPGVHQARRQLELLDANGLGEKIRIVANRVSNPMFGKADLSETETVLKRKINHAITNDFPTVSAAIDEGKILSAIKVKSRVEKDIRMLVMALNALVSADPAAVQ